MYLQSEPTVDPALIPSAANGASSTEPFELYFANDTHAHTHTHTTNTTHAHAGILMSASARFF